MVRVFSRFSSRVCGLFYTSKRTCSEGNPVRVRFAPSPTGNLHLGGLRTALYNFLYARKNCGKFILRIEDTDQKRVIQGSMESLVKMLSWAGIDPDESPTAGGPFGPYIQSQRVDRYREKADELLKTGHAYRCFCSETRLSIIRKEAFRNHENPRYDNKCRSLSAAEIDELISKGQPYTIRFKMEDGPITFEDVVFGSTTLDVSEFEGDFIILKSDGYPTYHFACVVDDHLMKISHVLRGAEWLQSTTKHIMLHSAFSWKPPIFAHLPLLVNKDRSKLSKRQEALGVQHLKDKGYEPLPLLNFLCGIGSGFNLGGRVEVLELNELHEKFSLSHLNTASCYLDLEKLDVYNTKYVVRQLSHSTTSKMFVQRFRQLLTETLGARYEEQAENLSDEYMLKILNCYKERISRLNELVEGDFEYLWTLPDIKQVLSNLSSLKINVEDAIEDAKQTSRELLDVPDTDFERTKLREILKKMGKEKRHSPTLYMRMMRIVLTGQKDGPGVAEIFSMLGKKETLRKLTEVLSNLESNKSKIMKQSS